MAGMTVVEGHVEPGYEPVARLFARMFRSPTRGGGSFVLRHGDRVLVDIWGGVADPATERAWTRDSLGLAHSTSKGVTATVIHRLADRGLLDYDEPVAAFWPAFAGGGKQRITVRQLLCHEAGLDKLAPIAPDTAAFLDHLGAEQRLAARAPDHPPGTPAYHGVTFGWLCAGLARAVTGKGIAELVHTEINQPLGIDGLYIGYPHDAEQHLAAFVGPSPRLNPRLARFARPVYPGEFPPRRTLEMIDIPGMHELFDGARPRFLDTEMPSANGMFTAESLATLYAALANNGTVDQRQLLTPATVRALSRPANRRIDRVLGLPMFWRMGYHQAYVPGRRRPYAFGHYGWGGSGGWADPATGLAAGFIHNRIYPLTTPLGDLGITRLSHVALDAHRTAGCSPMR